MIISIFNIEWIEWHLKHERSINALMVSVENGHINFKIDTGFNTFSVNLLIFNIQYKQYNCGNDIMKQCHFLGADYMEIFIPGLNFNSVYQVEKN